MTPRSLQVHSDDFDAATRAFEDWRSQRLRGTRIPPALWRMAVELAQRHGVSKTALALHLDYYALKKHLEGESSPSSVHAQPCNRFVEISLPGIASIPTCSIELEETSGTRLRIELKGICAEELASFARVLWSRAR